jgi:hypothetical protein
MNETNSIDIRSVKTLEQLKKTGELRDIIVHINKIIGPFTIPETVTSFDQLLPFALKANQIVDPTVKYNKWSEMFATHRAATLFCLTASPITSTMDRLEFLKFSEKFQDEPEKYKKEISRWFNKLKLDIESQVRTDPITHEATLKIDNIKQELEALLGIEIGDIDDIPTPPTLRLQKHKMR